MYMQSFDDVYVIKRHKQKYCPFLVSNINIEGENGFLSEVSVVCQLLLRFDQSAILICSQLLSEQFQKGCHLALTKGKKKFS